MDSGPALRLNRIMVKTQRELAFLRDLYIADDWTRRFAELADKHIDLANVENLLYLNAGTGNHCLSLRERADEDTAIFARCEDEDVLSIAKDKSTAVRSEIDFSMLRFEDGSFDAVVADGSLVPAREAAALIGETVRVARPGGNVAVMLPSAGSFGEIFSLIWEVLFNEDLGEHGAAAEAMILDLPTASAIEEAAVAAGLAGVSVHTANEVFEYDDGASFIASPLVSDFLLPAWLAALSENEKEQVSAKLAELIDAEDGTMTFRFSVKAAIVTGRKRVSRS